MKLRNLYNEGDEVTITSTHGNDLGNAMGHHDAGAAKTAMEKFGAIRGKGHGLQGMSYAINSMSGKDAMKAEIPNIGLLKFRKGGKLRRKNTFTIK